MVTVLRGRTVLLEPGVERSGAVIAVIIPDDTNSAAQLDRQGRRTVRGRSSTVARMK
jgi:hypothetical protein